MNITGQQAVLIRASFAEVAKLGDAAGELFYQRLFEMAPGIRHMFPANVERQAAKLTATLALVVEHVSALEAILPEVDELGRRHVGYGVEPAHYEVVGQVLLVTFTEALGDSFSPEAEDAWATAYGVLAQRMIAIACPEDA